MTLQIGANVDVGDLIVEHNADGTHFKAKNLKWGLDSGKAASPTQGDVYIATDGGGKFYVCYTNGSWVTATTDQLVKVSANDTVASYLNGKAAAGDGITLTENNDGANENLSFAQNPDWRPLLADGRLTLTSGVPVTTSDVIGATTLYYALYIGNRIALFDGANWKIYKFTERALSLAGLIRGVVRDIFLYDSSGTLTLELVGWKKVTASNNPLAGSNVVINLSDTATLAVGMEVTVSDGTNNEIATITVVVASTSITVDVLAFSYTTPDVYGYLARATALTTQDGVWVKSGAPGRRYLGSIRTTPAGQCEDSESRRYVWNLYNPVRRVLSCSDSTDSWAYVGVWRAANNNKSYGSGRVGCVIGIARDPSSFVATAIDISNAPASLEEGAGIGIDSTSSNSAQLYGHQVISTISSLAIAYYDAILPIGAHYIQRLESTTGSGSGASSWYGDANGKVKTGMIGSINA